jgi:Uma2 family endonuclease
VPQTERRVDQCYACQGKRSIERNGVQEYIVWRVLDQEIDWFRLESGCYVDLVPDADGILRSNKFPGLWLDRTALLAGNMRQVLHILQTGMNAKLEA